MTFNNKENTSKYHRASKHNTKHQCNEEVTSLEI